MSVSRVAPRRRSLELALALAFGACSLSAHAATYHVEDIGSASVAVGTGGLNGTGVVVGWTATAGLSGPREAVAFDHGTVITLPTLGGPDSVASGINDRGLVVGSSQLPSGLPHAVRWRGRRLKDLGSLSVSNPSAASWAAAVNGHGQVCGTSMTDGGNMHAFLITDGRMADLGVLPGGLFSNAVALNARGHAVGMAVSPANFQPHAVLYHDDTITDLGDFDGGAGASFARAINRADHVVGDAAATDGSFASHAFVWKNGTMHDLGVLLHADGEGSVAYGINDSDVIVGDSTVSTLTGATHAFVVLGGTMQDLNALLEPGTTGWVLTTASAVNANGQITGVGTLNGVQHAYLATPNP